MRRLAALAVVALIVGAALILATSSRAEEPTGKEPGVTKKLNRLSKEKSPYLLQHATNPVDWYPWGEEAFAKAKKENKPIFLSIGYSSCHWCHVMEHESFSDEKVAAYMNEHFVNIKVDREERPDVDKVYMDVAVAIMRGGGGWPLSLWLTPDKDPFYAGTYFPPQDMGNRPSFMKVLRRMAELWESEADRKKIVESAARMVAQIQDWEQVEEPAAITRKDLDLANELIAANYDETFGGFGAQPKFPSPSSLETLLRGYLRTGNAKPLQMVEHTLTKMAQGGIHDHIGGGFHRYSVTRNWLVPHFEKMLYDNAQLLGLYSWAYLITKKELFKETAADIARWVGREMTDDKGGFLSAQDADDPGGPEGEGGFYVWDPAGIAELFPEEKEAKFLSRWLDVTKDGNWYERPGKSLLQNLYDFDQSAKLAGFEPDDARALLRRAVGKMYEVREKRPKPMTDTKVLTAWNALMISGYCKAYQVFGDKAYLEPAQKAGRFLHENMTTKEDRLLRRWRAGDAAHPGVLADHAYLIAAYLDLYESDFDLGWLEAALALNKATIELFFDDKLGGFYFTGSDGEKLITRSKNGFDAARPSGNGVMAMNLLRIAGLTGDLEMRARAQKTLRFFGARITQSSLGFGAILNAADYDLDGGREIVIAGDPGDAATQALIAAVRADPAANRVVSLSGGAAAKLMPPLLGKDVVDGKPAAYVCRNFTCDLPVTDVAALAKALAQRPLEQAIEEK